jgi:hypothetical protein
VKPVGQTQGFTARSFPDRSATPLSTVLLASALSQAARSARDDDYLAADA